jgi:hypothetical protein
MPSPQPTKRTSPSPTKSSARIRAHRSETQSRSSRSPSQTPHSSHAQTADSVLIFAPSSCQLIPCALKSSVSTNITKCGFPTFTIAPSTFPTPGRSIAPAASPAAPPSRSRSDKADWHLQLHRHVPHLPPCVPNVTCFSPSLCASHAATHRVPLPESSASLPSALNSRRKKLPPLAAPETQSHPRQPLVFREHSFAPAPHGSAPQPLFHNQKVIPTRVGLHKSNHLLLLFIAKRNTWSVASAAFNSRQHLGDVSSPRSPTPKRSPAPAFATRLPSTITFNRICTGPAHSESAIYIFSSLPRTSYRQHSASIPPSTPASPTSCSDSSTITVASTASIYSPAPQAIPIDATTNTVAALVSPNTRCAYAESTPRPGTQSPAQCSLPLCPCPHYPSPASTADSSVKNAHAHADQHVRPQPRRLMPPLPFHTHGSAQRAGEQQTLPRSARKQHLVDIAEVVRARRVHAPPILIPPVQRLSVFSTQHRIRYASPCITARVGYTNPQPT